MPGEVWFWAGLGGTSAQDGGSSVYYTSATEPGETPPSSEPGDGAGSFVETVSWLGGWESWEA